MAKSAAEKRGDAELAERMVRVLESQRTLGGTAYPPTLRRLAALCDLNESDARVIQAAKHGAFKGQAVVAWTKDRNPDRDAPAFLAPGDTFDEAVAGVAPAVLVSLSRRAAETKTQALSIAKLKGMLPARLQKPFQAALKRGLERRALPTEVAWIFMNRVEVLFLRSAIQPEPLDSAAKTQERSPSQEGPAEARTPTGRSGDWSPDFSRSSASRELIPQGQAKSFLPGFDEPDGTGKETPRPADRPALAGFAAAFRAAFDRLDRENRSANIVRLLDLRRALEQFEREEFDAGLRRLRLDDEFTLSGHDGQHAALTDEERAAGVREAGSLLVYVARRT